jgi:hypothetical protein
MCKHVRQTFPEPFALNRTEAPLASRHKGWRVGAWLTLGDVDGAAGYWLVHVGGAWRALGLEEALQLWRGVADLWQPQPLSHVHALYLVCLRQRQPGRQAINTQAQESQGLAV